MAPDSKLLSYFDVLLRASDLELLHDGEWLNDQVIAFFFEHLARETHANLEGLLLVTGATAFLLQHAEGLVLASIAESMRLGEQQLVLFAVNDNPDLDRACGGSHWSLLALCPACGAFRHYDSSRGSNGAVARALSSKLNAALRPSTRVVYEEMASPQQRNGYDCGMYVLAAAQLLCQRFAREGPGMAFQVSDADIAQAGVSALRRELRQIIVSKAEAQRRTQQQDGGGE